MARFLALGAQKRWSRSALLFLALGALSPSAFAEGDVYSTGADPLTATAVQNEQAQARFVRGKQQFEAGDYAAALVEFDAARAIVASPNARLYRARCLQQLGRLVEGYNEFGATWVDAQELSRHEARYQRTAESAQVERAEIGARLAFVRLSVLNAGPSTLVAVNGEQLRRSAWGEPVPLLAGPVELRVMTPGAGRTQEKSVLVASGETLEVTFDLAESSPHPEPPVAAPAARPRERASLRPYSYASAGVGVLGASMFTVFGLMAKNSHQQLEARCPRGSCPAGELGTADAGATQQLLANVGLAAGILGLSGGVTLFVLEPSGERTRGLNEPQLSVAVSLDRVVIRGRL
ncbi:MAG: hypothetical protein RJA70_2301 [Pseudomonadota bacterium]|jgi:hypothetical protein